MNIQSAKKSITPLSVVIPDDLIAKVLSFLPVKSLVRFRYVTKYWKTLISDPTLVKLHLNRSASRNPLFTLVTRHVKTDDNDSGGGLYLGLENMDHSVVPYSLNHLIENPSFNLVVNPYYHLNYEDKDCSRMVGSCNGLILLVGSLLSFEFFCLWNPATMTTSPSLGYFSHGIPSSNAGNNFPFLDDYNFSFGCDNSTGTYKIVASNYNTQQQRTNVRILSFCHNNAWREIQCFPIVPILMALAGEIDVDDDDALYYDSSVYLSSTLNWLAIHNHSHYHNFNFKDITLDKYVIVSLHLGTETYNQYRLPRGDFDDEAPPMFSTVAVLGGFLCCSYFYKETDFLIWQMKEFGVDDSWTRFLKISYRNLQIDYNYIRDQGFNDDEADYHFQLFPLLLSEDEDTLVLQTNHDININTRRPAW